MNNIISKIKQGVDIDSIFQYVINRLYTKGAISTTDMEILSYLALYQKNRFETYKDAILNYMGLFYKQTKNSTLKDVVFAQYRKYIIDSFDNKYTPVQATIVKGISHNKCFSFSAPTSTGKSYVFMNEIQKCSNDVVVVVPSRALINEYYIKLCSLIQDKRVNILTFVDKINTKHAQKNVFVVTPERCRELFRQKTEFKVDLFLFDEAQLSNEESVRGLYFDSIVRRSYKAYPNAKFIFAHPFVQNPESQIEKNHFDASTSKAVCFKQKNVGQMFLCVDKQGKIYHFGLDEQIMGNRKIPCDFNPIEEIIRSNGAVLFYISKSKIYTKEYLEKFKKYIDLCEEIQDPRVDAYIEQLKSYTGGDTIENRSHYSQMLSLLKRGIVIHHGSLPLQTRIVIENFTREGFCRICFATSTLEQGINMPFDLVYLDRLEGSKPLSVKNLIGRAGRTTMEHKFDYGYVVINSPNKRQNLRQILINEEKLEVVSLLEKDELKDDDYKDFKDAILNDTYSDEFNLTNKQVEKLDTEVINTIVSNIISSMFRDDKLIPLSEIRDDPMCRLDLYNHFDHLYSVYLCRDLTDGERNVLNTAVKIIIWRIYGKTFKNICWYRYSYAINSAKIKNLRKQGLSSKHVEANFIISYSDIPDKSLNVFSMYEKGTLAKDVDYDRIVFDTYDYIDKLIGFKLCDIYYAAFIKYYEKLQDKKALQLANFIKFGTDKDREIWMLRYGLSFEDIEILNDHIININSTEIVFDESIRELSEEQLFSVARYIY